AAAMLPTATGGRRRSRRSWDLSARSSSRPRVERQRAAGKAQLQSSASSQALRSLTRPSRPGTQPLRSPPQASRLVGSDIARHDTDLALADTSSKDQNLHG